MLCCTNKLTNNKGWLCPETEVDTVRLVLKLSSSKILSNEWAPLHQMTSLKSNKEQNCEKALNLGLRFLEHFILSLWIKIYLPLLCFLSRVSPDLRTQGQLQLWRERLKRDLTEPEPAWSDWPTVLLTLWYKYPPPGTMSKYLKYGIRYL